MSHSPLTLARRHVLGELYGRCERATKDIPVYLDNTSGERLGHVDECLGKYADAFTFHLSEEYCRRLAGGQFLYSFDYHFSESLSAALTPQRRRIKLISIFLTMRKGYQKPLPRSAADVSGTKEGAEQTT
jgi:hypothetical protein